MTPEVWSSPPLPAREVRPMSDIWIPVVVLVGTVLALVLAGPVLALVGEALIGSYTRGGKP